MSRPHGVLNVCRGLILRLWLAATSLGFGINSTRRHIGGRNWSAASMDARERNYAMHLAWERQLVEKAKTDVG